MNVRKKSPALAVLLSIIPGLGHVYAGEVGKGLVLFVGTGLAMFLMVIIPGLGAASSFAGAWFGGGIDFMGPNMAVAVTAPLFFVVVAPALVIYSMASSHRSIVNHNAAIDGALGDGPAETAGSAGIGGAVGASPAAASGNGRGEWLVAPGQAMLWGVVLSAIGLVLILPPLFPSIFVSAGRLWPLLLVVVGGAVIWGATSSGRLGRDR